MAFSDNLQFLRTRQGQTQEQLAELLEVSRQSVSKWESAQSYPEMDTLLHLCELYHVDLDTLLRGSARDSLVEDTAQYDRFMNRFSLRMALSIGGILAGTALIVLMSALAVPGYLSAALFLLVIAVCTVVIVASSIQNSNFRTSHPTIPDFYTQEDRQSFRHKLVWLISGGVGAILFGVVLIILSAYAFPRQQVYAASFFLLIIAGAVTSFVYAGIQDAKYRVDLYNRDNNPTPEVKKRLGLIHTLCASLMVLAVAVYVGLGLALELWDKVWWIFAVAGILCAVISIILNPYRDES